ncbi:MAG: LytTR family transcriptional regulator DNA-binding domain-containing protein [Clostridia bacterium]|nr:LytTR family transcriptional regulator DNA-binding domain-containing protein [Clostridia bacterium]
MLSIALYSDNIESISLFQKKFECELLKQRVDAKINTITNDKEQIEKLIKIKEIDFLILDTNSHSIEYAKKLRKYNKDFYLMFLSNDYSYLKAALTTKIFDYLIKPISPVIIHDLVSRIKDEINESGMFININKWQSIKASEIIYMEKSINRTIITTTSGNLSCTKTLDKMEDSLPKNFARCHRSFIINKDKIVSLDRKNKEVYLGKNIVCPVNDKFYI